MSWWLFLGYLGLQVALGYWVSRGIKNETDYFAAGRKLGTPIVAVSLFATWFGAETCLGSAGAVYESGLSGARADPLGYSLCLLLLGLLLATRLHRGGYLTLGDLYREKYGPGVERLVVIVLIPSSLIWAAAQVRAFGQVVSATMDVETTLAIYLAAGFVTAYTLLGGLLGDMITDFIQGALLSVGLIMMLVFGLSELGGVKALATQVAPERWSLLPSDESWLSQLDRYAVPIFGSLVAQELIARVVSAKSASVARRSAYVACGLYLLIGASPVLLGLLGPALIPSLDDPESLLIQLAENLLPKALFALFACALLSAILSTIDSILLASSSLISHNLLAPLLAIESDRGKVRTARLLVFATSAVALVIALYADSIYDLVETASAFGTSGVLVTTFSALFLSRPSARAAVASLIVGLIATPIADYVLELQAPFLASILSALLTYAAFARGTGGAAPKALRIG